MKKFRFAILCASVAVVLAAGIVWAIGYVSDRPQSTVSAPTTVAEEPVAVKEVTLTLTVSGVGARVRHTCMAGDTVSTCEAPVNGVWSTTVTVPAGTLVKVSGLDGVAPPRCSISDETATNTFVPGNISNECKWVAR